LGAFFIQFARRDITRASETASVDLISVSIRRILNSDPRLSGSTWASLLSLSAERTTEIPSTRQAGASFLADRKILDPKRTKTVRVRYSFQRTISAHHHSGFGLAARSARAPLHIFAEYIRDTRDHRSTPITVLYQTFTFGVLRPPGLQQQFFALLGRQPSMCHALMADYANNFRIGLISPFSAAYVPLSERFSPEAPILFADSKTARAAAAVTVLQ